VWIKSKSFKEASPKTKASLEIEEVMNFFLSLVILFSLNSILFGSKNPEMKGNLLKTLFPFPMDQDLAKNRNGRSGTTTSYISDESSLGRSGPICSRFGCDIEDEEDCSIPPGAQCCEGFSYDSRSGQCRYELFN
ncbi:hypothetical protein NPIL_139701, partial [Nephila pilipes]